MNIYLRCMLPLLLLLSASACTTTVPDSAFVSSAEADAFNERKLQALSDESEMANGLVVYFETDSSTIDPRYLSRLAYVANYLVTEPQAEVYIEAHTDAAGSPEQNAILAQTRADMIAYYIVKYGALTDQVNTRAWGEQYPACEGSEENELKYNRRAVVEWISHG